MREESNQGGFAISPDAPVEGSLFVDPLQTGASRRSACENPG